MLKFWGVRVLFPCLDGNQRWTGAAKVRKVLFAENRKERLHGVMQRDPENGVPAESGSYFIAPWMIF
jgi:hypothetical protein